MKWLFPVALLLALVGVFFADAAGALLPMLFTLIGALMGWFNIQKAENQTALIWSIGMLVAGGITLSLGGIEALTQFTGWFENFLANIGIIFMATAVTILAKAGTKLTKK